MPNEAVPSNIRTPGFAAFVREQIDLLLWAITLKEEIDRALRSGDQGGRFEQVVPLYKKVRQSCFGSFKGRNRSRPRGIPIQSSIGGVEILQTVVRRKKASYGNWWRQSVPLYLLLLLL